MVTDCPERGPGSQDVLGSNGDSTPPELSLRQWADSMQPAHAVGDIKAEGKAGVKAESQGQAAGNGAEAIPFGSQVSQADSEGASDGSAAEQLIAVVGNGLTVEAAARLLSRCGGDLERAVNAFYDRASGASLPAVKGGKSPAVSSSRLCNMLPSLPPRLIVQIAMTLAIVRATA